MRQLNDLAPEGFLSKKAGSFSGTPQSTVQLWTKDGLLDSDIEGTTGTGIRRKYSVLNCIEIAIIRALSEHRLSFKIIGQVMEWMRDFKPTNIEKLLAEDQAFMAIQVLDDGSANMNSFGYSKGELPNLKFWFNVSAGKDADKAIILNITRIAKKVLSQIG